MMKHSIHSAITPSPAFDCDFVRAAQLRVAELHASTAHPVDPPNLLELEQALGEQVQKCELWANHWRAIWLRLLGIFHHANKRFCNWRLKPLLEPSCA